MLRTQMRRLNLKPKKITGELKCSILKLKVTLECYKDTTKKKADLKNHSLDKIRHYYPHLQAALFSSSHLQLKLTFVHL